MKNIFTQISDKLFHRVSKGEPSSFAVLFERFQEILDINNQILELIAKANDTLGGDYIFDRQHVHTMSLEISNRVEKLIFTLDSIAPKKYRDLHRAFQRIRAAIEGDLAGRFTCPVADFVIPYRNINRNLVEAVGGKNAFLAEVAANLDLKIPAGFAITTGAYLEFIKSNDLEPKISTILQSWHQEKIDVAAASAEIRKLIINGKLPAKLEKDLNRALEQLAGKRSLKKIYLAVRSSAFGEDGERTFAGQYTTILNVQATELAKTYLQILADTYGEKAMLYRRTIGFDEGEVAMAVACQEMIDSKVSGVLYTMDPSHPEQHKMMLSATWGLGGPLVSGRANADSFAISRSTPHKITAVNLVHKKKALTLLKNGGTKEHPVSGDRQDTACLDNIQIQKIAATGLLIEKYFKYPQDIEFTINQEGELVLLQARRLAIAAPPKIKPGALAKLTRNYPVLLRDQGETAQKGVGSGPVFLMSKEEDLRHFPVGSILVARHASPLLAKVLRGAAGIITDVGSTTGHLATIAREFRVPCLLNTGQATKLLQHGQAITIDTEEKIIYQGIVKELEEYALTEDDLAETEEYRLLRRVLRKIEPLNLLDPADKNFAPRSCHTFHDITRFVHEKAVNELIDHNYYQNHDHRSAAGKLDWPIPIDLIMIDIGGGLKTKNKEGLIKHSDIASVPMLAMLEGLAHPKAWNNEPMSVDVGSFMSSLTRTFSPELAAPEHVGRNLAVVSDCYANVSLRLGYHFTMIDTYLTDNINDNYAYFRFFGGVTDSCRRARRAQFLGQVLASQDFRVETHDDLVVARVKKLDKTGLRKRLYLLGLLIGFTRQLDVKMVSDQSINEYITQLNSLMEENHDR
ncbi:MAG: PEP-utilizing enzyme [Desulfobulbaceae bacterium]|nr:PEP-utilizing enzyme [Desulfobulbaceae bacterium]HIJ78625.1 hypothetical protein [Deltaproteobacteria bacterium]